jgi:hypothetical protein
MSYVQKGTNNFLMSPNEGRFKLGLPWKDGGDELVGNGNMIKLSQVGTQYSGGDNNTTVTGGEN